MRKAHPVCLIDGKGRALLRRARSVYLIDGKGRALLRRARSVCLIDGKGRAPVDQGAHKESVTIGNLLIQHTVSRWCGSGCVHEGCGGVDHWLQTKDWALPGFLS